MISAALVPLRAPLTLDDIEEQLRQTLPYDCHRVEWVGYSITIPQIRVETPVPLTIQVDSGDYVQEECAEMADDAADEGALSDEHLDLLRDCTARLDIQSADYDGNRQEAADGSIVIFARTDLDPATPEVRQVLLSLASLSRGPVLDCVNGEWLLPPP